MSLWCHVFFSTAMVWVFSQLILDISSRQNFLVFSCVESNTCYVIQKSDEAVINV